MFKKLTTQGEVGTNNKLKGTSQNNIQLGKTQAKGQSQAQDPKNATAKDIKPAEKDLSSEEKLALIEIKPIEKKALDRAFARLCGATSAKEGLDDYSKEHKRDEDDKNQKKGVGSGEEDNKGYFTAEDVAKVLAELGHIASKPEIDLMIWEVDENLDKRVDREEFDLMFRRCIEDETGLEPKSLFNLVQFLMYAQKNAVEITEEDTLELIYVRKNSIKGLEDALKIIFGEEERRVDGIEKKINFTEYLDRRNKRALKLRREEKQAKKEARSTLKKKDEL